jgi:hypothetical protein
MRMSVRDQPRGIGCAEGKHAGKTDVRIIDIVDTAHPALLRMWDKRRLGYRAMGYRIDAICLDAL